MENIIMQNSKIFTEINGIIDWLDTHSFCNQYLFRLIDLIGATLVGVKPAELINIPINKHGVKSSDWEECRFCLLRHKEIKVKKINKENRKQVLIYHSASLDQTLSKPINLKILRRVGYPSKYSLEGYVNNLLRRLNSDEFPHEIGIFLGYPTKDVIGFMGHPSLKLVKTKGWQYYGNEKISKKRYESFLHARRKVLESIYSFIDAKEYKDIKILC
ncbi:MAG: DUF3793 family protein [Halanaerobiales bacterium]|nr:DUF3793 family protein [Halanaerobiales bacterium]